MSTLEVLNKEDKEDGQYNTIEVNSYANPIISKKRNGKSLYIRNINNEEEKYRDYVKTEIDNYFNSPDKYFDVKSPVVINKMIDFKDIKILDKPNIIRHQTFRKKKTNLSNFSPLSKNTKGISIINTSISLNNNNNQEQLPKYEIIDNIKLKNIFVKIL